MEVKTLDAPLHERERYSGLRIPLRDIFIDTFRPDGYPSVAKITQIFTQILDSVPEEYLSRLRIRGSTPIYGALQQFLGIHRRGTISFSLMTQLDDEIHQAQNLPIAQAIEQMEYAPDIDTFIEGVGPDEFKSLVKTIKKNLLFFTLHMPFSAGIKDNATTLPNQWFIGLNNPNQTERKVGFRKTRIHTKEEKLAPIDNLSITVQSVGKGKNDGVKMGDFFLAADHRRYNKEVFDTRKDPRFSLSWDLCAGSIEKKGKEYFFVFDEKDIAQLTKPMIVGPKFHSLPTMKKFLLLLRAAQKGAMAEDLLQLSDEGQQALRERGGHAAAIDPETIERFRNEITPEEVRETLNTMSQDERNLYESMIQQYMLTGFFYPHKFNEYCQELGIYRYFPALNLTQEQAVSVGQYLENNIPREIYEQILYQSTHPHDIWYKEKLWSVGIFDIKRVSFYPSFFDQLRKFINPFITYLSALNASGIPVNVLHSSFYEFSRLLQVSSNNIAEDTAEYTRTKITKTNEHYRQLFEFDTYPYQVAFAGLLGLVESAVILIPTVAFHSDIFLNPINLMAAYITPFLLILAAELRAPSAMSILLGKYSIEKHQKESGHKG